MCKYYFFRFSTIRGGCASTFLYVKVLFLRPMCKYYFYFLQVLFLLKNHFLGLFFKIFACGAIFERLRRIGSACGAFLKRKKTGKFEREKQVLCSFASTFLFLQVLFSFLKVLFLLKNYFLGIYYKQFAYGAIL